jgi:hypothetical protein
MIVALFVLDSEPSLPGRIREGGVLQMVNVGC